MKTLTRLATLGSLIVFVAVMGCSQEKKLVLSEATLKGKITYKGKPVPYALVIAMGKTSSPTANADDEGNFTIEHVEVGEIKIGVNTEAGRGHMMSVTMAAAQTGNKAGKPTFVDLPPKYFDPNTSGLTLTVADPKGINTQDIAIK